MRRGCSTQPTGPIAPLRPYVTWHGQWASNRSIVLSPTVGWASLPHSASLACIWLATAILPSTMHPGRSGVLIQLVRSSEKRVDSSCGTEVIAQEATGALPRKSGGSSVILRTIRLEEPVPGSRVGVKGDFPAGSTHIGLHLANTFEWFPLVIFSVMPKVGCSCRREVGLSASVEDHDRCHILRLQTREQQRPGTAHREPNGTQ